MENIKTVNIDTAINTLEFMIIFKEEVLRDLLSQINTVTSSKAKVEFIEIYEKSKKELEAMEITVKYLKREN